MHPLAAGQVGGGILVFIVGAVGIIPVGVHDDGIAVGKHELIEVDTAPANLQFQIGIIPILGRQVLAVQYPGNTRYSGFEVVLDFDFLTFIRINSLTLGGIQHGYTGGGCSGQHAGARDLQKTTTAQLFHDCSSLLLLGSVFLESDTMWLADSTVRQKKCKVQIHPFLLHSCQFSVSLLISLLQTWINACLMASLYL